MGHDEIVSKLYWWKPGAVESLQSEKAVEMTDKRETTYDLHFPTKPWSRITNTNIR